MQSQHSTARGFTLLELLIALAVFSILSVMAYSGLNSSLNNASHVRAQAEKLTGLQTAYSFIQRDIEQIAARSVRDEFGTPVPALSGGTLDNTILEFSRLGWRNPAGTERSQIQRVAYRLEEKVLTRLSWPTLDRASNTEPVERELLRDVNGVTLQFLDSALAWHAQWPPSLQANPSLVDMPRAVELVLDTAGFGEIRRVFRVPPGEAAVKPRAPSTSGNSNNPSGGSGNGNNSTGGSGAVGGTGGAGSNNTPGVGNDF